MCGYSLFISRRKMETCKRCQGNASLVRKFPEKEGAAFVGRALDSGSISGMEKSEPRFSLIHDMLTSIKTTQKQIDNKLQCSVCLMYFGLAEDAKMLPCSHAYHEGCIYPWLRLKTNCPDCRRELLPEEEFDGEEGELETTWEDDEPWTVSLSRSGRHVEVLESASGVIYIEPISPIDEELAADRSEARDDQASPPRPEDELWEGDEPWTVPGHQGPGVEVLENAGGTIYVETLPDPNVESSFTVDLNLSTDDSQLSPRPESDTSTVIEISSDDSNDSYPLPPKRRYEHHHDASLVSPRTGPSGHSRYWNSALIKTSATRHGQYSDSSISSVTDECSEVSSDGSPRSICSSTSAGSASDTSLESCSSEDE